MPYLRPIKILTIILFLLLVSGFTAGKISAQETASVLYVPLIGITSVPTPLSLPNGSGNITYRYAVKNFLQEVPLTDVTVTDDKCAHIVFITGDDNGNGKLDYSETWRYACTTKLTTTTQSTATATGTANGMIAMHKAYATVVVGSKSTPPIVSIINITKVAYPLSLPEAGGKITFTYKVNNPGVVPLGNVTVKDDKCAAMSGRLGDTNGNNLLDVGEVWIYTCTTTLTRTTTNTVNVTAYANGLKAVDNATITVKVDTPSLPDTGLLGSTFKIVTWGILSGLLGLLFIIFFITGRKRIWKNS